MSHPIRSLSAVLPVVVALTLVSAQAAGTTRGTPATARPATARPATARPATARPATAVTPGVNRSCSSLAVIEKWPVARLVDQLIVVPTQETAVSALAPSKSSSFPYGGIILFGSSAPVSLGRQIAGLRSKVPGNLGLLVMTDEEGGEIQRMANLAGSMPWPSVMGATMTPAAIESLATSVARRMLANGVNVDLAPVLDVDGRNVFPGPTDPDGMRSFSGNPKTVAADGVAFMLGMMHGGVMPVVKHFPGLGGSSGDTDYGPATTLPWNVLQAEALPPFQAAIAHGAPAVMMSNAVVLDKTSVPASISEVATTSILKQQMGFRGLVITDSLSAKALSDIGDSVPVAAVKAVEAGADMVLFNGGTTAQDFLAASGVAHALAAAARSGQIHRVRLLVAVLAVLAAKHLSLCPSSSR